MTAITLSSSAPTEVIAAPTSPVAVYLSSLGSERSRRTMLWALDRVASVLTAGASDAEACPWHTLRAEHMAALRARLAEQLSPASANLCLTGVRGVLRACRRMGKIDRGREADLAEVEPVRGERVIAGRYIETDELRRLFRACGREVVGLRDAAALALMSGYGLRVTEAAELPLERYNRASGDLTVIGKGSKERAVEGGLCGAREVINAWLAVRGDAPGPLLCPVAKGGTVEIRSMTARSLHHRVQQLGADIGIELSPHDLRRTFCSNLLDVGDTHSVQSIMGHASPVTTARYDLRGARGRRATMQRAALPV